MTKQRPNPKSKGQTGKPASAADQRPQPTTDATAEVRPRTQPPPPSAPPASRRSTYFEAVALYERGLEAIQRHDYAEALDCLNSVLKLYPEEKELHERVRLYLNVCERQVVQQKAAPVTVEERLYAATLAINGSRYDEALMHLRLVRDEDPDNDHALYMLAVAHAQRQELAEAIAHLERAVTLNPENRAIARQDPDLDPLRGDEAFRSALESAPLPRGMDRRRPPAAKGKSGR